MSREEQIVEAGKTAAGGKEFSVLVNKQNRTMSAYEIGFIEGAKWADSHPAWVSVEERLPEERKVVWVRKHFKRKYVGEFDLYGSAAFCNGEFQCDASGHVTHWMEIVPPVKKGGEE